VIASRNFVSIGLCLVLAVSAMAQEGQPGAPNPPPPQQKGPQPTPFRWFIGGGLGLAFGDVNYIEFSPVVGYQVAPNFQLGGSLIFRYRKDKRYEPDLSTTDFGGSLFGRYFLYGPVFLHGEVERINWEYVAVVDGDFTTVESDYTGLYAGAGFAVPTNPRAAMYMSFLYDFNYDSNEPSPNNDPWVIRIGYGVRF
jgi:hypothetical protein